MKSCLAFCGAGYFCKAAGAGLQAPPDRSALAAGAPGVKPRLSSSQVAIRNVGQEPHRIRIALRDVGKGCETAALPPLALVEDVSVFSRRNPVLLRLWDCRCARACFHPAFEASSEGFFFGLRFCHRGGTLGSWERVVVLGDGDCSRYTSAGV